MANLNDALEALAALDRLTAQLPADPDLDRACDAHRRADLHIISAYLHNVTDPERSHTTGRPRSDAPDDKLTTTVTKASRRLRVAALVTVACALAGFWLDRRSPHHAEVGAGGDPHGLCPRLT